MRFHFIVNPSGGSGRSLKVWRKVERIIEQRSVEYSVHFPTDRYLVKDIVHDLTNISDTSEPVYLIIVGGDGTLNVAINGIVNFSSTYIGLIPAGKGNDFAHSLRITGSLEELVNRILDIRNIHELDLGVAQLNTCFDDQGHELTVCDKKRYFNNGAGVGFDADVCVSVQHSRVNSLLSSIYLSKLAYLFAAIPLFFKHRHFEAHITVDGNTEIFHKVLFAVVMTEPYEGGGFKFCPDASPYDGMSDVCIAHNIKRRDFLQLLPKALFGKHTHTRGISMRKGQSYHIVMNGPMWIQMDGEVEYRTNDVTVTVAEQKLQFLGI